MRGSPYVPGRRQSGKRGPCNRRSSFQPSESKLPRLCRAHPHHERSSKDRVLVKSSCRLKEAVMEGSSDRWFPIRHLRIQDGFLPSEASERNDAASRAGRYRKRAQGWAFSVRLAKSTNGVGRHLRRLTGSQAPAVAVRNGSNDGGACGRRFGNLVGKPLGAALKEYFCVAGAEGNEIATRLGGAFQKQEPMGTRARGGGVSAKFFVLNFNREFAVKPRLGSSLAEFGKESNGIGQQLYGGVDSVGYKAICFLRNIGPVIRNQRKSAARKGYRKC